MTPEIRKDRPYVTVAADGSGQFRTISEGIAAAGREGVVSVRPGVYKENLIINDDIAVEGDGDKRKVIIEAAGDQPAISVTQGQFKLSGVSVRAKQNQSTCIQIFGGTSFLINCDLSGGEEYIVYLQECTTNIFKCCIHGSNGIGLVYLGQSSGVVEDCEIFDNKGLGIICTDASSPSFKQCKMYKNGSVGVGCSKDSKAMFEDCEMYDNKNYGVHCTDASSPTFKQCKMYNNKSYGVGCYKGTKAMFEGCEMSGNRIENFCKADTAKPTLVESKN